MNVQPISEVESDLQSCFEGIQDSLVQVSKLVVAKLGLHTSHFDTQEGMARVALYFHEPRWEDVDYDSLKKVLKRPAPTIDVKFSTDPQTRRCELSNALAEPDREDNTMIGQPIRRSASNSRKPLEPSTLAKYPQYFLHLVEAPLRELLEFSVSKLGLDSSHVDTREGIARLVSYCTEPRSEGIDYRNLRKILKEPAPKEDNTISIQPQERLLELTTALRTSPEDLQNLETVSFSRGLRQLTNEERTLLCRACFHRAQREGITPRENPPMRILFFKIDDQTFALLSWFPGECYDLSITQSALALRYELDRKGHLVDPLQSS